MLSGSAVRLIKSFAFLTYLYVIYLAGCSHYIQLSQLFSRVYPVFNVMLVVSSCHSICNDMIVLDTASTMTKYGGCRMKLWRGHHYLISPHFRGYH